MPLLANASEIGKAKDAKPKFDNNLSASGMAVRVPFHLSIQPKSRLVHMI